MKLNTESTATKSPPDDTPQDRLNSEFVMNTGDRNRKFNPAKPSVQKLKTTRRLDTKMVWLKSSSINIRYAELGNPNNPTVLMLHGVPENLQAWYGVAPLLAERYHLVALDWPGFGGSDPLPSAADYNSQRFADIIVETMDALAIDQAHILATDIALLASFFAGLHYPDRVLKLAVMDGIPFPRPQYASWELRSFAKRGSILGRALVCWFPTITAYISYVKGFYMGHDIPLDIRKEFIADGKRKHNQVAFLSYFQNFRDQQIEFEARLEQLKKPVLVMWGKQDRFISYRLAHEIADKLPDAELKIIDKAGHYLHMDRPRRVSDAVTAFFAEDDDARSIIS